MKKLIQTIAIFTITQLLFTTLLQAQNKVCYVWVNNHWERPRANKEYHQDSLHCITEGQSLPNFPVVKDQRGERESSENGNVTVVDHRIGRDMSTSLVRPAFEEMPVYRIQLRITTANNNGTDDRVWVQLTDSNQKFFLAKPVNFKPGTMRVYDIINAEIKKLKDIRFIKFGMQGNDGACFTKVELLINNSNTPLYATQDVSTGGTCFDNYNSNVSKNLVISYNNLRNHPNWNYSTTRKDIWRPPLKITKGWIVSLVEASIGNQMIRDGGDLCWGSVGGVLENKTLFGAAVEASFKNSQTLSFDLDLEEVLSLRPNPETDIDFEIDFRCEEGVIVIRAQNILVITGYYDTEEYNRTKEVKLISAAIGGFIPSPARITWFSLKRFLAFRINLNPSTPDLSGSCKKTVVTEAGDILLQ